MKLIRVFYFGAIPVVLLLGLYSGVALFYIVFFFQLFLLLAILAADLWTVRTFRYYQTLDAVTGETGGETLLHLRIVNDKLIPMALVEIDVELAEPGERPRLAFSLAPMQERRFELPVRMPYRGLYKIGMTYMRLTDIFGLTTLCFDLRKTPFYQQEELLVYPRAEDLDTLGASDVDTKLGSDRLVSDEGETMFDLRAWRAGDRESRVHWKASLAHGELLTRRFEMPRRESALVLLDCRTGTRTGEEKLVYADTMCRAAASVSLYARRRGDGLTLAAMLPKGLSVCEGDHEEKLSWLAALPFSEDAGDPVEALEQLGETHALFVMTDTPARELLPAVANEEATLVLITDTPWADANVDCVCIAPGASIAERWLL